MLWSARARAAGIERMVTISTRVARHAELLAIAERFPDVYCSVGTHPHYAHEELDISTAELVARTQHPKVVALGEAGLDYHYDNSPREAQERGFRNHIAAARQTGLPLVIHSREADDDTARILEEETGKGAFPAVLHCFTGGPDLARRAIALGLYRFLHRHPDLQEFRPRCAPSRRRFPPTASWSKPTRPISRLAAFAANATSRLLSSRPRKFWPKRAASRSTLSRNRPARISFACSPKCRARQRRRHDRQLSLKLTILGCGSSGGVPRPALGWGDCDPDNPKNRRRRTSLLVERRGAGGVTRVLVDTSPDLREQLLDAEVDWLDAVLYTHEHADHTHGIDDLRALFIKQRRLIDVYLDEHTGETMRPVRLLFRVAARQRLSADRERAPARAGEPVAVAGQGGPITALPLLQAHGDIASYGFRFGNVAYSCDLSGMPAESAAALAGLDVWIVDALRYRPHPSHFSLADALAGSSG